MKLYICKKDYIKESREVKEAIRSSIEMLYDRIKMYEDQGVSFNRIFNDDKVKYDKHGKFFTFKNQKSNMQLRILYSYFIEENEDNTVVSGAYDKGNAHDARRRRTVRRRDNRA